MIFLYIILALFALFVGLGIYSQKGEAPGLEHKRLKELGSKPNAVSSEAGVQPERAVAPLQASFKDVADAIDATGGTIKSRT